MAVKSESWLLRFLLVEHRQHLFQWLPFLLLALCPLMHVFMHGGHGGHGGHDMAEGAHGGQMPSITIGGGETKTLVWTASSDVDSLEYACNIPGHYESGMYGDINF